MPYLRRLWNPTALLLAVLASVSVAAQPPALRIVVIAGEDAVNIIQQKTAVAPLVEVRDRNNLPVPGVAVTFTIGGQGATFGGVSTLTVTTNAAGQAAAVGLTPTAAGAVQINAAAVFQGQTALTTITQTNVLTAAQAAGAAGATGGATGGAGGGGGAGAGSVAAGGGGGLSATTIGIVGAAVGGGAIVVTQLAGSDAAEAETREFGGPFSADLTLTFSGPCVRVERTAGTLIVELDSLGGATLTGRATIEQGLQTIVSLSGPGCSGPQAGQTSPSGMPPTAIAGPPGNLSFSVTETSSAGRTNVTSFTGAVDGDRISGMLTLVTRVGDATGSFTTPVTLAPR